MVQLYTGLTSHLTEVFPMHTMEELPDTLNDFIIKHGAPNAIRSDKHKAQLSCKVKDILCYLYIGHSTSEPEQQNQDPAEWCIQDVKRTTNAIMDRIGTPASLWLLCTIFVWYLFNHVAHDIIGGITPLEHAHGQ